MGEQTTFQFSIDGRTIAAKPRPEDQSTLDELLRRGADVMVSQSDKDTEGHGLAGDEIEVDVEGHAMTLRLPTTADAAALRRALAIGALTATVAIGGFVAGTWPLRPPRWRRRRQSRLPRRPRSTSTLTSVWPTARPRRHRKSSATPSRAGRT